MVVNLLEEGRLSLPARGVGQGADFADYCSILL